MSEEDLDHLELAGQGADVEGGVPLLGRRIDLSAPGEQVLNYQHMTLLAGQVQGVQTVLKVERVFNEPINSERFRTYCIAGVDVDTILEILQDLLRVSSPRCPQEGGAVIRLKKEIVRNMKKCYLCHRCLKYV